MLINIKMPDWNYSKLKGRKYLLRKLEEELGGNLKIDYEIGNINVMFTRNNEEQIFELFSVLMQIKKLPLVTDITFEETEPCLSEIADTIEGIKYKLHCQLSRGHETDHKAKIRHKEKDLWILWD